MKRNKHNVSIECEFCSKTIHGEPTVIKVEGALLNVCQNCTQFGNVVKPSTPKTTARAARPAAKPRPTQQKVRSPPNRYRGAKPEQADETLVDDYGKRIKNKRVKKKLSQKNLADLTGISVAQIQSFESGKMRPTDKEAKKLERELSITLFEELELEREFSQSKGPSNTTVGDIINIKRLK